MLFIIYTFGCSVTIMKEEGGSAEKHDM